MKKVFYTALAFVAAAVSCTKEANTNNEVLTASKHEIVVRASVNDTKTTLDENHAKLVWTAGDNFRLFTNAESYDPQTLTYAEGVDEMKATVTTGATEAYAYYFAGTYTNTDPTKYSAYINPKQTQTKAGVFNGQMLPMVGRGTISGDEVNIKFTPMATVLVLNIYSTSKVEKEAVKSVTVTPVGNTKFAGQRISDLTEEGVVYDAATSTSNYSNIVLTLGEKYDYASEKPADKKMFDSQLYVVLAKQNYSSLQFDIETNNGTYSITGTNFDLTDSEFYPVNINLAKAVFTPVEDFTGTYTILAASGEDTYVAMANTHKSNSNRLDEVSFEKGTTATGNVAIVWDIIKDDDGSYVIMDNTGYYLTASSSNDANVKKDEAICEIVENEDGSYTITQLVGSTNRYLSRNDSAKGFAFYGTMTQNTKLYLNPVEILPLINVTSENPMSVGNGNDLYVIEYAINNPTDASISAEADVDWIHDFDYDSDGEIGFEVDAQEAGAVARTGIITLSYDGAEDVYVTVNQAAGEGGITIKTIEISSASVVSTSSYNTYSATVESIGWTITFGGNNKSVGTNNNNRSKCNLASASKYAVAPVTTSNVASAFANTTSLPNVSKVSYTFNGGSNQTNTNVYLLYSSDNNTYSQVELTSGTQGAAISSGTEFEFDSCSGYFAVLFVATNTSGNWRIDDVNLTFTYAE